MADFTLTQEQYEALVSLSRRGATTESSLRQLEVFLRSIEKANGVTRYFLLVQWQESNQALPPTAEFPKVWPPELRATIELISRPIARADVDALIKKKAKQPVNVLVTTDPAGVVGWTQLDKYFIA